MSTTEVHSDPKQDGGIGICVDTDAAVATSPEEVSAHGPITDGARVAAQPTTDLVGTSQERETFIPVSRFAIIERLTREAAWAPGQATEAKRMFRFLAAWRHQSYAERLVRLKEAYLPFSPDRDTIKIMEPEGDERVRLQRHVVSQLEALLERANYRQVSGEQLDMIFEEESVYGLDLDVDLSEFEELLIFARGATVKKLRKRSWKKAFLGFQERDVPIYQRLFLLLKLKPEAKRVREIMLKEGIDQKRAEKELRRLRRMLPADVTSDHIYLKMFKQIPRADLQMMFPNTCVKFRMKDKLFLGVTAGGGTLMSIVSAAGKLALIVSNPIKALGALLGLGGVAVRQVMKFFNQKNQYMMVLAQNLYFHNLADNRGVLTLLADRAEEEDLKEEMLLYALLAKEPLLESELGEAKLAIEEFLHHEFGVSVNFDLYDALSRLEADKVVRRAEDGTFKALSPKDACLHIDQMWDAYLDNAEFLTASEAELRAA